MNLERIGATPALSALPEPGLILARVTLSNRDQYRLLTEEGELDAEASGALWYNAATRADMPVTGDWVAARVINREQAIVERVLPRRTLFARRAAGKREDRQPIAANVDLVFLVCGLDGDFNLRRLERYLTLAAESGAEPVVVLNKCDLCDSDTLAARQAEAASAAGHRAVIAVHTRAPEGLAPLMPYLKGDRTVALLGSSGVGKSSIVNCLLGEERLRTKDVRESDSRGRHTTTHRELIPLPEGGALIDTPGMRELQLWASGESVDAAFDEIGTLALECRFHDCAHSGEPGCAVQEAFERGSLSAERLASYRKLRRETEHHERMADPLLALEQKRKWKRIQQSIKDVYRLPKHR